MLSVGSFNVFKEKIVETVIELEFVCQTSTVKFFSKVYMRSFFFRAL